MKPLRQCVRALLAAAVLIGPACDPPAANPPENLVELRRHEARKEQAFVRRTIVLHNIRRVLDEDVPAAQRVESLRVVEKLEQAEDDACPALAVLLEEPKTPQAVNQAVVAFLSGKQYPGVARHVGPAMVRERNTERRERLVKQVPKASEPVVLTEIVKKWAAEKPLREEEELRYRQLVERTSGKKWDRALLAGLNSEDFNARGSAIEVLAARLPKATLIQRVRAMDAGTQAMQAMKAFAARFGYLPKTRRELLATVMIYRRQHRGLAAPARLALRWQKYGYRFNIRDFHLIHALASDPLRDVSLSRTKLAAEVSRAIAGRRQAAPALGGLGRRRKIVFRRGRLVDFDGQVESLNMADLWNLYLLNEMFTRARIRRMLRVTAERDRLDRRTQWGGLVAYESGKAEAKLYWPVAKRGDNQYHPSKRMMLDSVDALGFFVGHFSSLRQDPNWSGPANQELQFAKANNVYGVVITRLDAGRMNVAYFNPSGVVVDLGDYAFPER